MQPSTLSRRIARYDFLAQREDTQMTFQARPARKSGRGLSPVSVSMRAGSSIESWTTDLVNSDRIVHLEPQERVAIKDPVLQTALRQGWIPAEFVRLLGSGNAGTSLVWTAERRSESLYIDVRAEY